MNAELEEVMEVLRRPFGQGRVLENGEWRNVTNKEVAERVVGWGHSLDRDRLHNLGKWAGMINAVCNVDQPELLIEIDCALESLPRYRAALEELEQLALQAVKDLCPVSSYRVRDIAHRALTPKP